MRTDADVGWGFICVRPPGEWRDGISDAFTDVPLLVGPLYVGDGDTVVVGFGWPVEASRQIAEAIGADGAYLVKK